MKKLMYLLSIVLIFSLVLTGCSLLSNISQVPATNQSGITYLTKHTADAPQVIDLLAGQTEKVGEVEVWNDEDFLYVKYIITVPDWCLTETHLAVVTDVDDFPVNKGGNPKVGHFPYQCCYDEDTAQWVFQFKEDGDTGAVCDADGSINTCLTSIIYTIPLDWGLDADLFIAAHAVVVHVVEDECISVISDAGVEWLGLDEITWYNAVPSYVHPSWPAIPEAIWIWRTENTDVVYEYDNVPQYTTDPKYGWLFKKQVTLPDTAFDILGSIDINADNSYEFFLNGVFVDGEGTMHRDGPDGQEWKTIKNYSLDVNPGSNELSFRALNYFRTGTYTGNPAGLIFKAIICYDYIDQEESAWGDGEDFPGKNWATYFEYDVQGWEELEPIIVPAIGTKMTSINSLVKDHLYKFEASGTCNWRVSLHPNGYLGDAEYWLRKDVHGVGWTHMGIWSLAMWDGAPVEVEWGTYNGAHEYTFEYTPSADGKVTFFFYDDAYSDNSGSLTVTIYEWK